MSKLNFKWNPEVNPNTGEAQLIARTTAKCLAAGSKMFTPANGGKPYYINTVSVTDLNGASVESPALFYPGPKNKIEDVAVGSSYLTRVIISRGATNYLVVTSANASANTIANSFSDAEFDKLMETATASASMAI